jgi:hypothetical protein
MSNLPFVVQSLVPENREHGGVYQLTQESVTPTRFVEVNEDGVVIEESICALAKSAKFVDKDGNICDVPLRTGRVPSEEPEAVRYEMIVLAELIRGGQLPLASCPYTTEYRHIKGGPLVKPPEGEADCGGSNGPMGCAHMKKVVEKRRKESRKRYDAQQLNLKKMQESDVKDMLEAFGKTFGDAIAGVHGKKPAAIENLKNDKGEK